MLTDMDQPLGQAVGNSLEIREAVDTIRGEGPPDFQELVLASVAHLLALSDLGIDEFEGRKRAEDAVADGSALAAYERWIRAQGGDPDVGALTAAPVVHEVAAAAGGFVRRLGAIQIGHAALHLGAGRRTKEDAIDTSVGVVCRAKRGDEVCRRRRPRRGARPGRGVGGRGRGRGHRSVRAGPRGAAGPPDRPRHPVDDRFPTDRTRGWGPARGALRPPRPAPRLDSLATGRVSHTAWCMPSPRARQSGTTHLVPELPEVETERGRLAERIEGRRIVAARIDDARLTRPDDPTWIAARLTGRRVEAVERRGKYIVVRLDDGQALLVHLRMTGGFRYETASHERAVLELDDGARIAYRDLRRFGTWQLLELDDAAAHLAARLGPEPLGRGFTAAFLADRLSDRTAPVKAAVLDQRTVAGLGNIYADEALWHSGIHPLRPAGTLSPDEIARLREGIRKALRLGIRRQGADLGDGAYAGGRMQDEFRAYGRAGEPCHRCGTSLEKTRAGGRGTWYCPGCQI